MTDWYKATIRLLDAIALAIATMVTLTDQQWRDDIKEAIQSGKESIKRSPADKRRP